MGETTRVSRLPSDSRIQHACRQLLEDQGRKVSAVSCFSDGDVVVGGGSGDMAAAGRGRLPCWESLPGNFVNPFIPNDF